MDLEHTKGSEEPKGHEVPIAPATSTPATITTSSTLIPSSSSRSPFPVPEVSPYLTGVNSYPYPYSHFNLGYLNPQISQVNIGLVNPICIQDSEETTHEEAQEVQDQDQSLEAHDQEESFMDLGWSTVFRQIEEDKKQRRDELLLIEQKKKELEQQRMQIDRARYDLENREIRIIEAEPLIPIARQLQDLGTDINQFLPWVETIHEEAEAWKMDLTTASYRVAQDLRLYRQVGSTEKHSTNAGKAYDVEYDCHAERACFDGINGAAESRSVFRGDIRAQ